MTPISRRRLLRWGTISGLGVLAACNNLELSDSDSGGDVRRPPAGLLDPLAQPKFVNVLPLPKAINAQQGGYFELGIGQFQQRLGLVDPAMGLPLTTTVWGYNGSYPGPTFVARKNVPIQVKWNNMLGKSHLLPVDTTLHWAFSDTRYTIARNGVPVVTHLHGGLSRSNSDGLPDAWFTPGNGVTGRLFNPVYTYDNKQEGGTLWYHDHALGVTRLNVYAGLAGFYLLRDENEDALIAANQLPSGPYELGLAIQDRSFASGGQLLYPATSAVAGAPNPSVLPEFFGDFILVNGMAWPYLDVEPRQYRFRLLNGSDSRFYNLFLSSGQSIYQIGTDVGLLNAPVALNQLTLGPGERADIVLDFSAFAGQTIIVRNNARTPFPNGATVNPKTSGQIMAFRVSKPLDTRTYPLTRLPSNLRPLYGPIASLGTPKRTRKLLLFETVDSFGRIMALLGTVSAGGLAWHDPVSENPMVGDTELWEVYNTTPDAHPIHLHGTALQIVNRQKFSAIQNPTTGALSNIRLIDGSKPPAANERGWKDTAQMFPGEVTRIIARFDLPGEYVWHCHILSHEDHEMMRPYFVGPMV